MIVRTFAIGLTAIGCFHAAAAQQTPGPPPTLDASIIPAGATSTYAYTADSTDSSCTRVGTGTSVGFLFTSSSVPNQQFYSLYCGNSALFPVGVAKCPDPTTADSKSVVTFISADGGVATDPNENYFLSANCYIVDCNTADCSVQPYFNYQTQNNCNAQQTLVLVDYTQPDDSYSICETTSQIDPLTEQVVPNSDLTGNGVAAVIQGSSIGNGAAPQITVACNPGFQDVGGQCLLAATSVPRRMRRRDGSLMIKRSAHLPGFSH